MTLLLVEKQFQQRIYTRTYKQFFVITSSPNKSIKQLEFCDKRREHKATTKTTVGHVEASGEVSLGSNQSRPQIGKC